MSKKLTIAVAAVSGVVGFLAGLYFAPDVYMLDADNIFDDKK